MPLEEMVKENQFRQDLIYRINTVEIHLPPLRERVEDIPLLAKHFMGMYSKKYRKEIQDITQDAMIRLQKYQWPGNIRELQHALERAIIMSESKVLQPDDFFFLTQKQENAGDIVTDSFNLDEVERGVIHRAINLHGGNISKAAKELGLTRASLYRRLEKYGL